MGFKMIDHTCSFSSIRSYLCYPLYWRDVAWTVDHINTSFQIRYLCSTSCSKSILSTKCPNFAWIVSGSKRAIHQTRNSSRTSPFLLQCNTIFVCVFWFTTLAKTRVTPSRWMAFSSRYCESICGVRHLGWIVIWIGCAALDIDLSPHVDVGCMHARKGGAVFPNQPRLLSTPIRPVNRHHAPHRESQRHHRRDCHLGVCCLKRGLIGLGNWLQKKH
jgi:hypothetical protein